jgi:hypothetical protein
LVVLEEAAQIPEMVMKEIILPITRRKGTAVVGISTLGSQFTNIFTKLLESGVYYAFKVKYICQMCQDMGVVTICAHAQISVPDHVNQSMELEHILFGDDENTKRESLGIMSSKPEDKFVFEAHSVEHLFSCPRVSLKDSQKYIFVSIDPCAGSDDVANNMSDFCVVSIAHLTDTVIGVEAIPAVRASDYESRLIEHLERLRKLPAFSESTLVFDIEGNGNLEWSRLEPVIRRHFRNVVFMTDFVHKTGATNTTAEVKIQCAELMVGLMNKRAVRILDTFVTTSLDETSLFKEWARQMREYERTRMPAKGPTSRARVLFSGKGIHGKKKDDICFTMQRAFRSREKFFRDPIYASYRYKF